MLLEYHPLVLVTFPLAYRSNQERSGDTGFHFQLHTLHGWRWARRYRILINEALVYNYTRDTHHTPMPLQQIYQFNSYLGPSQLPVMCNINILVQFRSVSILATMFNATFWTSRDPMDWLRCLFWVSAPECRS